jgi:2-C-methyl-D-erythritol 4-phosphate cytidylyltransferase/2-C-methyl-D-erythritol 2,4-cyclodiphosphate synthase
MAKSQTLAAVIVAAGRGERAGNPHEGPKQYRLIGGRAVISWTLAAFADHPLVQSIVMVIHPDDHELYAAAIVDTEIAIPTRLVNGGKSRQQSVLNGLEALAEENPELVLIHDGVRPFASSPLINAVIDALQTGAPAALPALPLTDTIKRAASDNRVETTLSRERLFAAQTPQGFRYEAILEAHRKAKLEVEQRFTDDCSIAEWAGQEVQLVAGSHENVKLTVARDLKMANEKLGRSMATGPTANLPDVRTGNGYDVHVLVPGDAVTLCGVRIAHDRALSGHSDADVALHALTDALLATCGAGDIGDHFPPTDPQWKGAASDIFLDHAAAIVAEVGGTIMNADVTLICEAPKIGPHRLAMRQRLADILKLEIGRCSVKATTNEQIGFIGRREGIAAIATATVIYAGAAT